MTNVFNCFCCMGDFDRNVDHTVDKVADPFKYRVFSNGLEGSESDVFPTIVSAHDRGSSLSSVNSKTNSKYLFNSNDLDQSFQQGFNSNRSEFEEVSCTNSERGDSDIVKKSFVDIPLTPDVFSSNEHQKLPPKLVHADSNALDDLIRSTHFASSSKCSSNYSSSDQADGSLYVDDQARESEDTYEIGNEPKPILKASQKYEKNLIFASKYSSFGSNEADKLEEPELEKSHSFNFHSNDMKPMPMLKNHPVSHNAAPATTRHCDRSRNRSDSQLIKNVIGFDRSHQSRESNSETDVASYSSKTNSTLSADNSDFVSLMERGINVIKYSRKRKPSERILFLDTTDNTLFWVKAKAVSFNQGLSMKKLFDTEPVSINSLVSIQLASKVASGIAFPKKVLARSVMMVFTSRILNITLDTEYEAEKLIGVLTAIRNGSSSTLSTEKNSPTKKRHSYLTIKLPLKK